MKNLSLIAAALLLLSAATTHAQTKQDSLDIRRDMNAYMRATLRLDYDSLLLFMPPATFGIAPKEEIKQQLREAFESEEIKIKFEHFEYGQPTPVGKTGEHLYAIIPYDAAMTMTIVDADSTTIGMVFFAMQLQFGSGNVERKPDNNLFIKTPDKRMIAIKSPEHDTWKFIEDKRNSDLPGDNETQQLVDLVIPKEVLEATKK
jgi:hypothetical protein